VTGGGEIVSAREGSADIEHAGLDGPRRSGCV
jgi:hypothetical protein